MESGAVTPHPLFITNDSGKGGPSGNSRYQKYRRALLPYPTTPCDGVPLSPLQHVKVGHRELTTNLYFIFIFALTLLRKAIFSALSNYTLTTPHSGNQLFLAIVFVFKKRAAELVRRVAPVRTVVSHTVLT